MPFKDPEKRRAYSQAYALRYKKRRAQIDKRRNSIPENKERHRAHARADYYRRRRQILAKKCEQYAQNREVMLERGRQSRRRHPDSYAASVRRYAKRTRYWLTPKAQERQRSYYQAHKQEYRERERKIRIANPVGYKASRSASWHKRRAILAGQKEHFTQREWVALKKRFGNTCLRCGKSEPLVKLTPDHIVPLSKDGSNSIDNIQPLCGSCNCAKGTRIIDYRPRFEQSHASRRHTSQGPPTS